MTSFKDLEQVRKKIEKKKRTLLWSIAYSNKWKHFRRKIVVSFRRLFVLLFTLLSALFCSKPFGNNSILVKSFIAPSTYFWLGAFWVTKFGGSNRYTGLPNGLDTSLISWTLVLSFLTLIIWSLIMCCSYD